MDVSYRIDDHTETSIWGRNLLEPSTLEGSDPYVFSPVEAPRSVFI